MANFKAILKKLNKNYKYQKWSDMSCGGFKTQRINEIKHILEIISGNDSIEMIKDIFKELRSEIKFRNCIENIGELFKNNQTQKNFSSLTKRKILKQVRNSGISYSQAFNMGFNASKYLWKRCLDSAPNEKRGRKALDRDLIEEINRHIDMNSSISSYRTVKSKEKNTLAQKENIPVKFRSETLMDLYSKFEMKEEISFSCFYSYIGKEVKRSQKLTDLCGYCENGNLLAKILLENASQTGYFNENQNKEIDTQKFKEHFESINLNGKHNDVLNMLYEFSLIEYHKKIASHQRLCFNNQKKNESLLKDNLLFVMDYKEKIRLGYGPREISDIFYQNANEDNENNQEKQKNSRVLLGIGIYYFCSIENKIKCINVDVITHILSTDGLATVRILRFLRKQSFFQDIDKKKYIFWMDTGSHFRCSEVNHYFFKELALEKVKVTANFHAEKHGKSCRDQHFSILNKFMEKETAKKQITSTEDVINCYVNNQEISNQYRKLKGLDSIILFVLEFIQEEADTIKRNFLDIKDVSCYYNFENVLEQNQFVLKTTVLSDYPIEKMNCSLHKSLKSNKVNAEQNNYKLNENIFRAKSYSFTTFKNKIEFIKLLLGENKSNQQDDSFAIESAAPIYCKLSNESSRRAIKHCNLERSCKVNCQYTPKILKELNKIGQDKINTELFDHGHPKCRIMNKKTKEQRTTEQGRQELLDHYLHFHKFDKNDY